MQASYAHTRWGRLENPGTCHHAITCCLLSVSASWNRTHRRIQLFQKRAVSSLGSRAWGLGLTRKCPSSTVPARAATPHCAGGPPHHGCTGHSCIRRHLRNGLLGRPVSHDTTLVGHPSSGPDTGYVCLPPSGSHFQCTRLAGQCPFCQSRCRLRICLCVCLLTRAVCFRISVFVCTLKLHAASAVGMCAIVLEARGAEITAPPYFHSSCRPASHAPSSCLIPRLSSSPRRRKTQPKRSKAPLLVGPSRAPDSDTFLLPGSSDVVRPHKAHCAPYTVHHTPYTPGTFSPPPVPAAGSMLHRPRLARARHRIASPSTSHRDLAPRYHGHGCSFVSRMRLLPRGSIPPRPKYITHSDTSVRVRGAPTPPSSRTREPPTSHEYGSEAQRSVLSTPYSTTHDDELTDIAQMAAKGKERGCGA